MESEIFDLVVGMDADDAQLEYATLYASAKNGWATNDMGKHATAEEREAGLMSDLLAAIIETVPSPAQRLAAEAPQNAEALAEADGNMKELEVSEVMMQALLDEPFRFAVNAISYDPYLGRLITGKIHSGTVQTGTPGASRSLSLSLPLSLSLSPSLSLSLSRSLSLSHPRAHTPPLRDDRACCVHGEECPLQRSLLA